MKLQKATQSTVNYPSKEAFKPILLSMALSLTACNNSDTATSRVKLVLGEMRADRALVESNCSAQTQNIQESNITKPRELRGKVIADPIK